MKNYIAIFSVMFVLLCCKQREEFLNIEDYSIKFPSNYIDKIKTMSIEYEKSVDDKRKLILFNQPFKLSDDYELIILFNDKIVYKYSTNKLKIPTLLQNNENISTMIIIINKGNCYAFESKEVFLYSSNDTFYYLSFYPTNKNEVPYSIIPSTTLIQ
jgi:hypothetical protein